MTRLRRFAFLLVFGALSMACVAAVQVPVLDTKQIIMVGERITAGGPDGYGYRRTEW